MPRYVKRGMKKVVQAGFKEKEIIIDGDILHYAEGPANGPALLLIHGQSVDWTSYFKVLPALSKIYHVYAIDCHGHGHSNKNPYKYSAEAMGTDFARFIEEVVKEPVIVSGHSSGGLLAVWLAANRPDLVKGAVLEDPPLFSSEAKRYNEKNFAYLDMSLTCHNFLNQTKETDFSSYYIEHSAWIRFFKNGKQRIVNYAKSYRKKHPDCPLYLFFLPASLNEALRGLLNYDPEFGNCFYDATWHRNFDHAKALESIVCPTVLIHTKWKYDENGVLLAVMDGKDAEKARSLMRDCELVNVKTGHGFHFEKPEDYVSILRKFRSRVQDLS